MTHTFEFGEWPRLADHLVAAMPANEQMLIRQHEEETIAASKMQLADVCNNCHVKPQFAKTYRVLRRDLRQMLDRSRRQAAQPTFEFSDAFQAALIRSTDEIVSHKLRLMANHFYVRWGESIENWAGKEGSAIDKSGCCVFLLITGSCISATVLLFL